MKVTLIDREPTHVAYLRHIGPYGAPIGAFWRDVVAPWMQTNGLFGRPRYGISHDDPGIAAPEKSRYDACVEVAADFSGTGDYHTTTVPGGRYASARFQRNDVGHRRRVGDAAARLAAGERHAARRAPVLRVLRPGCDLRSKDRRLHVRHLHSSHVALRPALAKGPAQVFTAMRNRSSHRLPRVTSPRAPCAAPVAWTQSPDCSRSLRRSTTPT